MFLTILTLVRLPVTVPSVALIWPMRRISTRTRREELEGAAAGGGFRVAEHDADFLADLVGEDADGAGLGNEGGEFAHGGAHQAGLGADGGIADLAVEFLLGDQGGDGVEHDDIDGIGADEGLADLQGFLAGGGLGNEQVVEVDAEFAGVLRVERVFDIDEGGQPAALLGLGDDGEGEGGLAGGFRTEDFDDAAAREAADAKRAVDEQVAGGNDIDIDAAVIAQAHDGAFAELLLDMRDGEVEVAFAGFQEFFGGGFFGCCFGGHGRVGWCRGTACNNKSCPTRKKMFARTKKCLGYFSSKLRRAWPAGSLAGSARQWRAKPSCSRAPWVLDRVSAELGVALTRILVPL